MAAMTPQHARWEQFVDRLAGPDGIAFTDAMSGEPLFTSRCQHDLSVTDRILREMGLGEQDINATIEWLLEHGGGCDCEVLTNVDVEGTALPADELERVRDNR